MVSSAAWVIMSTASIHMVLLMWLPALATRRTRAATPTEARLWCVRLQGKGASDRGRQGSCSCQGTLPRL